jgi:hypothetical protein
MSARPMALLAALTAIGATALVALPAGAAATHPTAAAAATVMLPSSDPFYQYANSADGKASVPLAGIAPGTVLNQRSVDLGLMSTTAPAGTGLPTTAEQLLYRTADELGHPTVTVTTVIVPPAAALGTPTLPIATPGIPVATPSLPSTPAVTGTNIVAYLSFYDSLSGQCDPSYTLQGGSPGPSSNDELTELEQGLVEAYRAGGVVTVPDFEGEALDWTAGHEAGYGTLDAIRATEAYLKVPQATTQVGLTGYSGGSIAADWASELQPAYAPDLDIVGVAEGGVPVDFAHNLDYINGSQQWSGIIPAVLDALSRSYGIDLDTYLSPLGKQLTTTDSTECIGQFLGSHPGLTVQQLLKPQYQDFLQIPAFVNVVNKLIMGTAPGHPLEPLYIAVGNDPTNAQGQGDDIMVTGDVEALAHEYCGQGVSVDYTEFPGADHDNAALLFEPDAMAFLQARFAGVPVPSDCAAVPTGNSLAPIVIAKKTTATATSSTSPTPTFSTSVEGLTITRPATATTAAAGETGTLAFTGSTAAPAIAALILLGAGGATVVLRRRR